MHGVRVAFALFVIPLLAGCVGGGGGGPDAGTTVEDPCGWGLCIADPTDHPDWTLPQGATAAWTYGAPYTAVDGLIATDSGLAWVADRDGMAHVEHLHTGTGDLHSVVLPASHSVGGDQVAWDGHSLWFTHSGPSREEGTLVRWSLDDDQSDEWPFDGIQATAPVVDAGTAVLLQSVTGAAAGGIYTFTPDEGLQPLQNGHGITTHAAIEGSTLLYTSAWPQPERLGGSVWMRDRVTGSEVQVAQVDTPLVGAWGNHGRFAFAVSGAQSTSLHEVDRVGLDTKHLANGTDPILLQQGVYFWEDTHTQSVFFRSASGGEAGHRAFAHSQDAWTAAGPTLWWFDEPSIDPRFKETPNPTGFVAALYRST